MANIPMLEFGVRLVKCAECDRVEVVKCGDCKHCDPESWHCDHPQGTDLPIARKPEDYCSYGERRSDDV